MEIQETLFNVFTSGGLSIGLGYGVGRITRAGVDIIKWLIGAVVAFQLLLAHYGIITIDFERAGEVMGNVFGTTDVSVIMSEFTNLVVTVIPSTLGLGAGFYTGYKKMII